MPGLESGERATYATELAGVWCGLAQTLAGLDALAADPTESFTDERRLAEARRFQYALHTAGELVLGIAPPDGSEQSHDELGRALVEAREATAEILDEVETAGAAAAAPLVYEWRGALFRVRLARLRLAGRPLAEAPPEPPDPRLSWPRAWFAAFLALGGALLFVAASRLEVWPL
ncbi:MAG: hypothetical protein M3M94_01580 [Actinomycetota bacterium]|nr:hypothetical protein [Actinomycetota bacterium]